MPKKILIFSIAYYPRHVSGAEAAIKEITDRISDIEFHMVTLRFDVSDPAEEKIGNIFVHRVGSGGSYFSKILFPLSSALLAKKLYRQYHFDSLWAMMTYMLLPVALLHTLGLSIPYAVTLQDGDPYEKVFGRMRIRPFIPFIDWGFKNATIIQTISTYLATWPRKRGYAGEIVQIYNGANPKDLHDSVSGEEVSAVKEKVGKRSGDIYIGNSARLVYQKGFDTTLRALPLLPENIHFLIVGGGEDEEKLKVLAAELGVEKRVIFTGQVDRNEVTKYRKAMDIFVGPSRSEGLGNAFLSAMASRIPVVATQEGGIAEFLFDEKRNPGVPSTGWAVDADNPQQIAQAIEEILASPEKVKRVTETARKMVEEKFDWDTIAKDMRVNVFAKVLA